MPSDKTVIMNKGREDDPDTSDSKSFVAQAMPDALCLMQRKYVRNDTDKRKEYPWPTTVSIRRQSAKMNETSAKTKYKPLDRGERRDP